MNSMDTDNIVMGVAELVYASQTLQPTGVTFDCLAVEPPKDRRAMYELSDKQAAASAMCACTSRSVSSTVSM